MPITFEPLVIFYPFKTKYTILCHKGVIHMYLTALKKNIICTVLFPPELNNPRKDTLPFNLPPFCLLSPSCMSRDPLSAQVIRWGRLPRRPPIRGCERQPGGREMRIRSDVGSSGRCSQGFLPCAVCCL